MSPRQVKKSARDEPARATSRDAAPQFDAWRSAESDVPEEDRFRHGHGGKSFGK
jgi:hypothetical protein